MSSLRSAALTLVPNTAANALIAVPLTEPLGPKQNICAPCEACIDLPNREQNGLPAAEPEDAALATPDPSAAKPTITPTSTAHTRSDPARIPPSEPPPLAVARIAHLHRLSSQGIAQHPQLASA